MSDLISKAAAIQAVFDWEQGKISGTIADAIAAIPATDARADALREALAAVKAKVPACANPDELRGLCLAEAAILRALEQEGR